MGNFYDDKYYSMIGEAVEKHQDYLFRFAYFRIGNRKDAEDVVQNVFLKVLDKKINLADERMLKMYLFRAVYHACIDYSRSAVRFVPIEDASAVDDGDGTTDEELQQEYRRISRMLDEIPEEQADVIRMNTIDGLSYVEISEITGLPVTTVKSRFKLGIDKIRTKVRSQTK